MVLVWKAESGSGFRQTKNITWRTPFFVQKTNKNDESEAKKQENTIVGLFMRFYAVAYILERKLRPLFKRREMFGKKLEP